MAERDMMTREKQLVIVRGAGDLATGTIYRLWNVGYPVLALETEKPTAIRRRAALSEAMYEGVVTVEDLTCRRAASLLEAKDILAEGDVPLMNDPNCEVLKEIKPWALVDGILAKRNLGTNRDMAKKTIALGPGFCAGKDVDLVVETKRGHNLGRIIKEGEAIANTGIPGIIGGYGKERVLHAPEEGRLRLVHDIGDFVEKGETVAVIETAKELVPVRTEIAGLLRGILRDGSWVKKGLKMADVDPRKSEYENCFTISDKARAIGGGVLEGLLYLERMQGG